MRARSFCSLQVVLTVCKLVLRPSVRPSTPTGRVVGSVRGTVAVVAVVGAISYLLPTTNNQQPATMTTLRPFRMDDLFRFNNINLDVLTETYNMPFYLQYISQWPEAFTVAEGPDGSLMGYMLGKAEGMGKLWHGHVSAVTVAPTYRRLGLARTLMEDLDKLSTDVYNAHFVDLFVRASNGLAISMYESFGYVKYRRVLGYYSGDDAEDAWDMRKALPRDKNKESVVPLDHPIRPMDLEW